MDLEPHNAETLLHCALKCVVHVSDWYDSRLDSLLLQIMVPIRNQAVKLLLHEDVTEVNLGCAFHTSTQFYCRKYYIEPCHAKKYLLEIIFVLLYDSIL